MPTIKQFRKTRHWTLKRLADEVGVTLTTVWRWENDRVRPSGLAVKALRRIGYTP